MAGCGRRLVQPNEAVGIGFGLGSILATLPLVIAVLYHRWANGLPSIIDEMALLTVTIAMLVTGLSWKNQATTRWGGTALTLYLIVLIASLAYRRKLQSAYTWPLVVPSFSQSALC